MTECMTRSSGVPTDRHKRDEALAAAWSPVESARLLRFTLDGLASHLAVVNNAGEIVFTNKAYRDFAEQNGVAAAAVSERVNYLTICDAAQGKDVDYARNFARGLREVIAGSRPSFELEYPCHAPNEQRWFLARVTRFPSDESQLVIVSHENISSRMEAERRLQRVSDDLLRTSQMARVGGWSLDLTTNVLEWSDVTREIHEVASDFVPDMQSGSVFFREGENRQRLFSAFEHCVATGAPFDVDVQIVTATGRECWVRTTGLGEFSDGRCVRMHGTIQDIDERKRSEDLLRMQMQRADALLALPRLADDFDEKTFMQRGMELSENLTGSKISFIHFINKGGEDIELVAWSRRTLEHYCTAAFDSHYPVSKAGIWADALREGRPVIFNDYPTAPNRKGLPEGHSMLQRLISVPVMENGRVVMLAGVGNKETDYTEFDSDSVQLLATTIWQIVRNARSMRAARESSTRLERLSENLPGALFLFEMRPDGSKTIPYASAGLGPLYGVSQQEVIEDGASVFALLHPDDEPQVRTAIQESARTLTLFRVRHRNVFPDGRTIWVEAEGTPEAQPNGSVVWYGFTRDVTDRVVADANLRKLTQAVEQSDVTIFITDRDGTIEYANPNFEKSSGYTVAEALGQNPRILQTGDTPRELYEGLWKSVLAGNEWRGELKNKRKDGSHYWESVVISPVRDANGTITNFVAVKEDITEHKRLVEERTKLQSQLNQAQKMESVGRLAGGVAHDFNNLLTVINGTVELALSSPAPAETYEADLGAIQEAAQRATVLTRQLLTFSRQGPEQSRDIEINEVVTPMLSMLRRIVGEDVAIDTELAGDAGLVRVDVGQLEQVITNLAVNARDAMPRGGRITVSTSRERLAYNVASPARAGEYVRLTVRDTGTGMSAEVQDRLFEPFFTTKAVGKGTGLGLAIVYGIVTRSGGTVTVESSIGMGTAFHVLLPRLEQAVAAPPEAEHAEIVRGTGIILVVDDEPALGSITQRILQYAGYTVLLAHSGEEAIHLAEQLAGKLDLLISDVIMPDMYGPEVAAALRVHDPALRVMFVSGHSGDILTNSGLGEHDYAFLAKPFSMPALTRKVKDVLAG